MKTINTTRFGKISYSEDQTIVFPLGIPGFPEREYLLLTKNPSGVMHWIQSIETPDLAFVVIEPCIYVPHYRANISAEDLNRIGVNNPEECLILSLLTFHDSRITVNMQAPIVINRIQKLATQFILENKRLSTQEPLDALIVYKEGETSSSSIDNIAKHMT